MFKKFSVFLLLFIFSATVFAQDENPQIDIWNSARGLQKLDRSRFKNDFYQLANFYQPQMNPLFCGVATATIIRNALDQGNIPSQAESEIHKPQATGGGVVEFHLYSQSGFFNEKTDKIKKREIIKYEASTLVDGKEVYDPGMSLTDYSKILSRAYKLKVDVTYAEKNDQESVDKFRKILKNVLTDNKRFLVVNFDGKLLGNQTRGHISPLVAFDEESDSVLILDVALHKNPWYWVSVEKLYTAMNSLDNKTFRGYLVVGR
jgi:hypothetical protein